MKLMCLITILSCLMLAGCNNTVKGFGQDMQQNGKDIQKSINS